MKQQFPVPATICDDQKNIELGERQMRAEYICPVLTAFDENGKVDMEAMKRQFDHLI